MFCHGYTLTVDTRFLAWCHDAHEWMKIQKAPYSILNYTIKFVNPDCTVLYCMGMDVCDINMLS